MDIEKRTGPKGREKEAEVPGGDQGRAVAAE